MVFGESSGSDVLINNLDADNLLHIQTNDNSSTALIPFKLQGTENYRVWASAVKLALKTRNKFSFVNGTCLKTAYTISDVLSAQWDRCNAIVLTWIMNSISQDVYMVWSILIMLHQLNSLWREFDALIKLPKCVCEVKCSCAASSELVLHQLLMKLVQFLLGLDDCYQPIKSALLTSDHLLEVKDAYTNVSREESHRGIPKSSGVNQHLTVSTVGMFNVVDITSLKITVGYPNGTLDTVSHVGNLKLSNNVIMYDVLMVLDIVSGLKRKIVIGTGSKSGGLYLFDMNKDHTIGKSNMVMCYNASKLLWHNRLGHSADQVLSVLHNDLKISKSSTVHICEVCHRVKQTKDPFLFKDIREVWVYLVKTKDEVFDVFVYFISLVANQFKVKLKTVRLPSSVLKGRAKSVVDGGVSTSRHDNTDTTLCQEENTATQIDDKSLPKGNNFQNTIGQTLDKNLFEQEYVQIHGVIRSSRQPNMPAKFNDYVVNSNVKYGIEKFVSYTGLNSVNLCFASTLNKFVVPTCYNDALKYTNWVDAMNNKIEALNRNNTRIICNLPTGFDYDETFSLVVKMATFRYLISIVVVNSWPLYQLDVNNAFLYGDLVEDVYMTLPQGYDNIDRSKVCKLTKSLYRLKQAKRQWNAKLTTALAEHGFKQSKFDYSLYIKQKGVVFISMLVYIDDIVITDLGVLKCFLGIKNLKNENGLCMPQRKYCLELLYEYGLLAARPVDIHFLENSVLCFEESENDKYLSDFTSYQKLVGKLIYLTNTRPDIGYVVHCLNQHMHSPLQSHFKVALRVLRYLKGSGCGIQFNKRSDLKLIAFADANWAKSMSSTSCEIIWLGYLLHSLGLKDLYPMDLNCDNSSAIQIDANRAFHDRTKHFELDVHFVREKVMAGIIKIVKINTNLQVANIFTKCLGVVQHNLFCRKLGLPDMFVGVMVG
ncbi:ribonuclease H-like domain-containing protein [Tanacetum coccineum]